MKKTVLKLRLFTDISSYYNKFTSSKENCVDPDQMASS